MTTFLAKKLTARLIAGARRANGTIEAPQSFQDAGNVIVDGEREFSLPDRAIASTHFATAWADVQRAVTKQLAEDCTLLAEHYAIGGAPLVGHDFRLLAKHLMFGTVLIAGSSDTGSGIGAGPDLGDVPGPAWRILWVNTVTGRDIYDQAPLEWLETYLPTATPLDQLLANFVGLTIGDNSLLWRGITETVHAVYGELDALPGGSYVDNFATLATMQLLDTYREQLLTRLTFTVYLSDTALVAMGQIPWLGPHITDAVAGAVGEVSRDLTVVAASAKRVGVEFAGAAADALRGALAAYSDVRDIFHGAFNDAGHMVIDAVDDAGNAIVGTADQFAGEVGAAGDAAISGIIGAADAAGDFFTGMGDSIADGLGFGSHGSGRTQYFQWDWAGGVLWGSNSHAPNDAYVEFSTNVAALASGPDQQLMYDGTWTFTQTPQIEQPASDHSLQLIVRNGVAYDTRTPGLYTGTFVRTGPGRAEIRTAAKARFAVNVTEVDYGVYMTFDFSIPWRHPSFGDITNAFRLTKYKYQMRSATS